jgi:hypothetical protein
MIEQASQNPAARAEQVIRLARETLDIESDAVLGLKRHIGATFVQWT